MKGLMIKREYADLILSGAKTWEIRGQVTAERGRIALLASGTKLVVGTCEILDVVGPLTLGELRANVGRLGVPGAMVPRLPYAKSLAWVVGNPVRLKRPVPYRHPSGAVVWVRLSPAVARRISAGG